MYNSQIVTERIKKIVKEKNLTMENLNSECNLSKNAISSAGKSTEGMKARNLYVIADYLGVSVDYLLGREEKNTTNITTANNSQIDNSTVIGVSNGKQYDETTNQVAEEFSKLSFSDKIKVMSLIAELNGNK